MLSLSPFVVDSDNSFKPATKLVSGSVMDILNKKTTAGSKSVSEVDVDDKPTPNGNIGGIQPASEMRSGSVMDILGKSSSKVCNFWLSLTLGMSCGMLFCKQREHCT